MTELNQNSRKFMWRPWRTEKRCRIVLFYLTCDFDYYFDLINNQSIIPSTDVIQLTLTLNMTTAQVVETSVTVNNNSPIQDCVHPDDLTQPTFEITGKLFSYIAFAFAACCRLSKTNKLKTDKTTAPEWVRKYVLTLLSFWTKWRTILINVLTTYILTTRPGISFTTCNTVTSLVLGDLELTTLWQEILTSLHWWLFS